MNEHSELDFIFRVNISRFRQENGWSLRDCADEIGISFSYLGKILRGEQSPRLSTVSKAADALGIPPARLITQLIYSDPETED